MSLLLWPDPHLISLRDGSELSFLISFLPILTMCCENEGFCSVSTVVLLVILISPDGSPLPITMKKKGYSPRAALWRDLRLLFKSMTNQMPVWML